MSFWEAFMNGSGDGTDLNMAESNLGAYLETALGGMTYVLFGVATLFGIGYGAASLLRMQREKKLSGRERVQLEYGRIQSYLNQKYQEFRKLRTLREQLQWIRCHSKLEIGKEQEEALYQVYFAENADCDCEKLCMQLRKMRSVLKIY